MTWQPERPAFGAYQHAMPYVPRGTKNDFIQNQLDPWMWVNFHAVSDHLVLPEFAAFENAAHGASIALGVWQHEFSRVQLRR